MTYISTQSPGPHKSAPMLHPAEELFELRAQLRALKLREAELRDFFLTDALPQDRIGPFHTVTLHGQQRRNLVKSRLPQAIVADPQYYDTSKVTQIRLDRGSYMPGFSAPPCSPAPAPCPTSGPKTGPKTGPNPPPSGQYPPQFPSPRPPPSPQWAIPDSMDNQGDDYQVIEPFSG